MLNKKVSTTPQHHALFLQKQRNDLETKIPVLYLEKDGHIRPVTSLIEYFNSFPFKGDTWKKNTARALGLFWDYCIATSDDKSIWEATNPHRAAFRAFAMDLITGTVSINSQSDPTGLYWPPTSQRATRNLISALESFVEWCDAEGYNTSPIPKKNLRPASPEESIRFLYVAMQEKQRGLLSHLKNSQQIAQQIANRERRKIIDLGKEESPASENREAIAFPEDLIEPLLSRGFTLNPDPNLPPHEQEDITAKMITLLMLFGGTRISEPFHLWFNDVVPDSQHGCRVFLRHPSQSSTYLSGESDKTRAAYLKERGLFPRNTSGVSKSYRAGWKNLATDSSLVAPVYFVHEGAEYLFRNMYLYYLRYREGFLNERRLKGKPDHPFLFISRGTDESDKQSYVGEPYSIASYNKALKRAYARLEQSSGISIPFGKNYGTTAHGFRHRFGRMLEEGGMNTKTIQKAMRHRSPMSQAVYTGPTAKRIESELNQAREAVSARFMVG